MRRNKESLAAQLGITQEFLSIFLGVGRSSIAMYELSKRQMPYAGSFKSAMLSRAFNGDQKPSSLQGYEMKETALLHKMLEKRIKTNEGKLFFLQTKFKKYCERYAREANALRTAGLLLENLPPFSESPIEDQNWLRKLEADAWFRMQKYGKAMQANMQLKIESLEFEIAAAKKKLAELDS